MKPRIRRKNGYRLYDEDNLLKMQQIIALKFFGFNLKEISSLLEKKTNSLEHITRQAKCLLGQAKHFELLGNKLSLFAASAKNIADLPWINIISLIKEYKTMENGCKNIYYACDSERQKACEKELLKKEICSQKTIDACKEKLKSCSDTDWSNNQISHELLVQKLIDAKKRCLNPSSEEVQCLVKEHYKIISFFWVDKPNKNSYMGLADGYLNAGSAGDFYNAQLPGLSSFLSEAMKIFANKIL